MWAMIPMFLVQTRGVVLEAILRSAFFASRAASLSLQGVHATTGPRGPGRGAPGWDPRSGRGRPLPAVVGEGLVRFGHLLQVLAPLHRRADAVAGVEQLVGEAEGHALLATLAGVAHDPADGERVGATGADLDGHLVGGTTDAAAAHLEGRLDVLDRSLQRGDRVTAGLLLDDVECVVDDALGDRSLPLHEHLVDDLGDQELPV